MIPSLGYNSFRLQACKEDGSLQVLGLVPSARVAHSNSSPLQSQVIELRWETILAWEVDDEGMAFCVQYHRPDKAPRWLRIFTPYFVFLCDCFDRVQEERKWADQ